MPNTNNFEVKGKKVNFKRVYLDVGGAAMMREVERFDEIALLANEVVKFDDMRHVVTEGDNADTHPARVDVETER